ncbi:unnamed protein product [Calicophoron daubneyi]|uniref:Ig-like domain-containing protein n=1 Tax=Calicophoron daubneyi TaxID=300641 RepID=A0AAV2TNR3_CALDB
MQLTTWELLRVTTILVLCLAVDVGSLVSTGGTDFLLPEFSFIPPPISYIKAKPTGTPRISCSAWPPPPMGRVTYHVRHVHSPATSVENSHGPRVPSRPVLSTVLHKTSNISSGLVEAYGSVLEFSRFHNSGNSSMDELQCLVTTNFGSLLSPPFQVFITDFNQTNQPSFGESFETRVTVVHVLQHNTATIECHSPQSPVMALVQFTMNSTALPSDPDKYLQIYVTSTNTHLLLIREVSFRDEGAYQCSALNPVTGERWVDSCLTHLKVQSSPNNTVVRLVRGFNGASETSSRKEPVLTVKEGENVSLHCIFVTSPFQPVVIKRVNGNPNRLLHHRLSPKFGVLSISRVNIEDEGVYECSVGDVISSCYLKVKSEPRLLVSSSHVVRDWGDSVSLSCHTSENLIPVWYFNGRTVDTQLSSGSNSSVLIPALNSSTTGIYQCVVRTSDGDWKSETVLVSLTSQRLISRDAASGTSRITKSAEHMISAERSKLSSASLPGTADWEQKNFSMSDLIGVSDRGKRNAVLNPPNPSLAHQSGSAIEQYPLMRYDQPNSFIDDLSNADYRPWFNTPDAGIDGPPVPSFLSPPVPPSAPLSRPNASAVGDNLAVLITWQPVKADYYHIQFRHKRPIESSWSPRVTAEETITECCGRAPDCCRQIRHAYLTGRQPDGLEAGRLYQFRIQAISGRTPIDKSPWSEVVSFAHIANVAPVITETERLPGGGILARWSLSTSAVGFPVDHFLLLYRQEERLPNGKITYNRFRTVFVPGHDAREYKLTKLEPGKGYQIVVYGVYTPPGLNPEAVAFTGGYGGRRITQFSHEIFVKPRSSSTDQLDSDQSDINSMAKTKTGPLSNSNESSLGFNSAESNRLMFLILGALAGLMLIVMICLVILCVWRQQRDKQRLLVYRNSNGSRTKPDAGDDRTRRAGQTPGAFMLEHLSASLGPRKSAEAADCSHPGCSNRSSLMYPQPPPVNPPPPPPKDIDREEMLELQSLMSGMGYQQQAVNRMRMTPASMQLSNQYHPSVMGEQTYWTVQRPNTTTGARHRMQALAPNYCLNNAGPSNPPVGLKREPPSGGSVHDGTDTEADPADRVVPTCKTGTECSVPSRVFNAGQGWPNPTYPEQFSGPVPHSTHPMVSSQLTTHSMLTSPLAEQYVLDPRFQPVAVNNYPCSCMPPGLGLESYGGAIHQQEAVSLNGWPQISNYDPGLSSPVPAQYNVDPRTGYPLAQHYTGERGSPYFPSQKFQCQQANQLVLQDGVHHSTHSDGRRHRRRRRKLTTEGRLLEQPPARSPAVTRSASLHQPLMTSSPVNPGLAQKDEFQTHSHYPPDSSHPLPTGQSMSTYPMPVVLPPQEMLTCQTDYRGPPSVDTDAVPYPQAYTPAAVDEMSSALCGQPTGHMEQWLNAGDLRRVGYGYAPKVPAHQNQNPIGPLSYGVHNPAATLVSSDSLSRRLTPNLFFGAPRIRDYSEYGIPHVMSSHSANRPNAPNLTFESAPSPPPPPPVVRPNLPVQSVAIHPLSASGQLQDQSVVMPFYSATEQTT